MPRQKGVWLLPTVRMDPKIAALWAAQVAAQVFEQRNIPCSITSWYRDGDFNSLHAYHAAVDIDANIPVNEPILVGCADIIQDRLGGKKGPFDVLYHEGHIHMEYDPDGKGVAPYKKEEKICLAKSKEKSGATASKAKEKGGVGGPLARPKAPAGAK